MNNFHLPRHGGLHFNHRMEQVFEFLALSIKRHWCGLDRSDSHRLCLFLQIDQDVG